MLRNITVNDVIQASFVSTRDGFAPFARGGGLVGADHLDLAYSSTTKVGQADVSTPP
jgi:hypothetical protein